MNSGTRCLVLAASVLGALAQPALARDAHPHRQHGHRAARLPPQSFAGLFDQQTGPPLRESAGPRATLESMIAHEAAANGVPVSLVHRVIMRESRYNARAITGGNYGLMQIRLGTARAMGYGGSAAGLLDPQTNVTYAVRYLAGAYRAAGGNESRALYASGYHASRRRRGPI